MPDGSALTDIQGADATHAAGGLWCFARRSDQESGTHRHNTLELGCVLTGAKRYRIGDLELVVRAGEMWCSTMWEPHSWQVLRPGTTFVSINFSPEFMTEIVGALSWFRVFAVPASRRPRISDDAQRRVVRAVGTQLYEEVTTHSNGWDTRVKLGLAYLLSLLLRDWESPAYQEQAPPDGVSHLSRVMPALSLTAADPGRRVSRQEAAAACSLSPSRFQGLFRQTMGLTFEQFVRESRVTYARHLLLTTQSTVAAIAAQTGFADESHFHRVFASHCGCTPAVYRAYRGLPPGARPPRPMLVRHTSEEEEYSL